MYSYPTNLFNPEIAFKLVYLSGQDLTPEGRFIVGVKWGEVGLELRFEPCWTMLVIGSLSAM